jgi:hypothetical protein
VKYLNQLGPQTTRLERRYGSGGVRSPGGVNSEKNGGSIPPHQFVRLINIDWKGDELIPRPGQSRLHADVEIHDANARIHPHDFRLGCPTRLWHVGEGCPGEALPGAGFFIGHYDQEQEPVVQRAAYYPLAVNALSIATYGGQPYMAVDDQLRRLNTINVPWGQEQLTMAGQGSDLPVATFPGFCCPTMIEFDGYLFLILKSTTGGTHKIATWDGKTLRDGTGATTADLAGILAANEPVAFGLWRDSLVLGYVSAANKISIRARGNTPGTWTDVAPGAGTVAANPGRNSIVSYKDEVYIADGGANVWNYDGTTLAIGRTVAGATIRCVEQAFGYLFYGYKAVAPGDEAMLGRYDNTTWVDVHRNLTVDQPNADYVNSLSYYRESLAVTVQRTGTGTAAVILESDGRDTSAAFQPHPLAGSLNNAVRYTLVL